MSIDAYVQQSVAETNGRLYRPLVNRLRRYPIPECPLPAARERLLLDIGCGWGRWMMSASRKGYLLVGVDVKLDALRAARRVLRDHAVQGYVVAADLQSLPFQAGIFDAVFSYSVLQHVHRRRAGRCVGEVHRVLAGGGLCMLEFPISHGLGNLLRGRWRRSDDEDDDGSWCVRYYAIGELERLFGRVFGNVAYQVDCYLGIGVQPSDLDMLPRRYQAVVLCSEILKRLSRRIAWLKRFADSVYMVAIKDARPGIPRPAAGRPILPTAVGSAGGDNLDVLDWLACPATGGPLVFDAGRSELVSRAAGVAYPVRDGIPVLLAEEARSL